MDIKNSTLSIQIDPDTRDLFKVMIMLLDVNRHRTLNSLLRQFLWESLGTLKEVYPDRFVEWGNLEQSIRNLKPFKPELRPRKKYKLRNKQQLNAT